MTPDLSKLRELLEVAETERDTASETVSALLSEVERLTADVAFWKREAEQRSETAIQFNLDRCDRGVRLTQAEETIASLRLELTTAREALEPFAQMAPHVECTDLRDGNCVHRQRVLVDGEHVGWIELCKDDFRRAAAALLSGEKSDG